MKRVLFVFPTDWDRRQLPACRSVWDGEYEVLFAEPGEADRPWGLDVLEWIDRAVETWGGRIDGVASSSDDPGAAVAAALATALGLPGSRPEAVLGCSHKFHSRIWQREAASEATPRFALLDPERPPESLSEVGFPCFVKPVKGSFSVLSRQIDSLAELREFLTGPGVREFLRVRAGLFDQLLRRYADFERGARYFLAEELLAGIQVTVEGWIQGGEVEILGVLDSVMHPGTRSFRRFDYPSRLPSEVQDLLAGVARLVAARSGLENTMFNVEAMFDRSTGAARVIEVNPRMCGQFADLYHKVDGTNGYEVALALAAGRRPEVRRREGPCRVASSNPLRIFEPVRVLTAPDDAGLREAEALFPGTLAWSECKVGEVLADFESGEDGASCRYGIVNLGARDEVEREARLAAVVAKLGYRFDPVAR